MRGPGYAGRHQTQSFLHPLIATPRATNLGLSATGVGANQNLSESVQQARRAVEAQASSYSRTRPRRFLLHCLLQLPIASSSKAGRHAETER